MTLIPDAYIEPTLLANTARTASINSPTQTTYGPAKGLVIYFDSTVNVSTETLQVLLQYANPVSGAFHTVLDGGAIDGGGSAFNRTLIAYPNVAGAGADIDTTVGYPLARTWRVRVAMAGSGTANFSVGASYIY